MTRPQPLAGGRGFEPRHPDPSRYLLSVDLGTALQIQRVLYADTLARLDAALAEMTAELGGGAA